MKSNIKLNKLFLTLALSAGLAAIARADSPGAAIYEKAAKSLVAVQWTLDSEAGRRELVGAGIVIGDDGLVMTDLAVFDQRFPESQIKDVKIIIPHRDRENEELDAVFVGRDRRYRTAYVKLKEPRKLEVVKFVDAPVSVGDEVFCVGLMSKDSGYGAALSQSAVAALQRGPMPMILCMPGGLGPVGSVVFNPKGDAIGFVSYTADSIPFINDEGGGQQERLARMLLGQPKQFQAADRFLAGLSEIPKAGESVAYSWTGIYQMSGVKKEVSEFYGLGDAVTAQVSDVVPDSPAAKAGLKQGMIITKVNGKDIVRGDTPDEVPAIINEMLFKMKPGTDVTLTTVSAKGAAPVDVKLTLGTEPPVPSAVKRFFGEDLGFATREVTFWDLYRAKRPLDTKGVVVAFIKAQSAAQTAKLGNGDMIQEMNGKPVTSLDDFKEAYQALRKDKPKEPVVLVVMRGGNTQVIRVEPPQ